MSQPAVSNRPEAGIYLHIPFCAAKCRYCSFNSYVGNRQEIVRYLAALEQELRWAARHPCWRDFLFTTVYIGGGTPSLCSAEDLARLVGCCCEWLPLVADPEVTMEANPNSLSAAQLRVVRNAGVNRISIGVQSLNREELLRLGRLHSPREARDAVAMARSAGFDNISLDLMYKIPGQSEASWELTVQEALALQPEHLSLYELMVEEKTPFADLAARGKLHLPDEKQCLAMDRMSRELLEGGGYRRYEISNYARKGRECRHNITYWRNGSWLAVGAGAVSSLRGLKMTTIKEPLPYATLVGQGALPYISMEGLCRTSLFRETVIMGLRMTAGIDLTELDGRFGIDAESYYGDTLRRLVKQGLLVREKNVVRFSARGLLLANQVLSQLV